MTNTFVAIKRKIKTLKKRFRFKDLVGLEIRKVESLIVDRMSSNFDIKLSDGGFIDLGGVNNAGMFIHKINSSDECIVTKIQKMDLADREVRFLKWHSKISGLDVSANYVGSGSVNKTNYGWLSSTVLFEIDEYEDRKIESLFHRMNISNEYLSDLSLNNDAQSLSSEIVADTKIKNVLKNLVCKFPHNDSFDFIDKFIDDRAKWFVGNDALIQEFRLLPHQILDVVNISEIEKMYGFVHGDFKKQNIMKGLDESYRIIDLQYYTYGIRVWDLAFYYSKDELSFTKVIESINCNYTINRTELYVFILFYIVAASLHLKKKTYMKVIDNQVGPAIAYLSSALDKSSKGNNK
jgi:thiamine kinase-like enzyme